MYHVARARAGCAPAPVAPRWCTPLARRVPSARAGGVNWVDRERPLDDLIDASRAAEAQILGAPAAGRGGRVRARKPGANRA